MAGAASIFIGEKLLTTNNNDATDDDRMLELLGKCSLIGNLKHPHVP